MEFAYDRGGLAKGGNVTLFHDGNQVGEGRVEMTQPMVFSADETTDIGRENGTTVASTIKWVQIDLGDDDHDHFIEDEERLRIAMAKQWSVDSMRFATRMMGLTANPIMCRHPLPDSAPREWLIRNL